MNIQGIPTRTIAPLPDLSGVSIIDQTRLPFRYELITLRTLEDAAEAISEMRVRGAPLIGATAAYGVALALSEGVDLDSACATLAATRPTAVNLAWALGRMKSALAHLQAKERQAAAWVEAAAICDEDVELNRALGGHGAGLISAHAAQKAGPVNVLTHCNAGWLAFVDWGTALAPIYYASREGRDAKVWVDETRPRGQGARLTAWELKNEGISHEIIPDNAGAYLMSKGKVDMMIVGADRIAANGDFANKIGTYEKAVLAKENGIPFYTAAPVSTFDFSIKSGMDIPIEERCQDEVRYIGRELVCPKGATARNPAFDMTPARYVTGIITENGIFKPGELTKKKLQ